MGAAANQRKRGWRACSGTACEIFVRCECKTQPSRRGPRAARATVERDMEKWAAVNQLAPDSRLLLSERYLSAPSCLMLSGSTVIWLCASSSLSSPLSSPISAGMDVI